MGKALTTKRHATSASAAAAFGPETSTANTAEFRLAWCFPKPEVVALPFSPNASAAIESWNPRTTAPDCKKENVSLVWAISRRNVVIGKYLPPGR